ncbi:MAG: glycosyltransferase family 4 protein [Chloroflexota bacterium]|nr:glycosyltransferase family 4 protein [Chloroflexota bacterium]
MSLQIAYDAGPARSSPTGVGVYVRDLGLALKSAYRDRIRIFGSRRDGPLAPVADGYMHLERYQIWMQGWGSREALRTGAEMAHYTNAVAPIRSALPFVLTVQDLSVLRFPRYHPMRRVASTPIMVWAVRRARRILVPSTATADELIRLLHVPARKLVLTELAPGDQGPPVADSRAQEVLRSLGMSERPYVLSIGTLEPRKNVHRLVAAFERTADRDSLLVLLGGRGWHTSVIDRAIERSEARDRIRVLGYVTDEERMVLLQHCTVFAYVSIYEGYGLPVVEAMSAGAAVVTSAISSMPEAAGGAGVLVDPYDIASIAAGVDEARARRDELIEAGLERTRHLTWERTAGATMVAYESAFDQSV